MSASSEPSQTLTLTIGPWVSGGNFFGRQKEVEDMWERLLRGSVLLLAPRRVGKTSLMRALKDAPRFDFKPHFIDLQSLAHPAQFVAALAQELDLSPSLRERLGKVPGLGDLIKATGEIKVGDKSIRFTGPDWRDIGTRIIDALREPSKDGKEPKDGSAVKRLFLLDEFPYFVQHMAKHENGRAQCDEFLAWFRKLRCEHSLSSRIRYVLSGSIGLSGLLSRLKLSATVNDIRPFYLGPFNRETALDFIKALEQSERLSMQETERELLLDLIGYFTPYYIQLMLSEIREQRNKSNRIVAAFDSLLAQRDAQLRHMEERLSDVFPEPADLALADSALRATCAKQDGLYYADLAQAVEEPDRADKRLVDILETLRDDGYLFLDYHDDSLTKCRFTSELLRRYWKRRNPC